MKMHPSIATASGRTFNFLEPEQSEFTIEDIAAALSKICRFTGHTKEFYSVAQHSVLASQIVPKEWRLQALLHDASEAFMGDVSTPLKQLLPDYRRIEEHVNAVVMGRFGVSSDLHGSVKQADLRMLKVEVQYLMPETCREWPALKDVGLYPFTTLHGWTPATAEKNFLRRYYNITGKDPRK